MNQRSFRSLLVGSALLLAACSVVSGQGIAPKVELVDGASVPIPDPNDPPTLAGRFMVTAPPGSLWALVPSVRVRAPAGASQEILALVQALANDFPFLEEVAPYDPRTILGTTSMVAGWDWQAGQAVVHPLMLAHALSLGTSDPQTGAYAPSQLLEAFQAVVADPVNPSNPWSTGVWDASAPNWLTLMENSLIAGRQHTLWSNYAADDDTTFPIDGLVTMATYLQAQDDVVAKNFLSGAIPGPGGPPYEGQPPIVAAVEQGVLEVVIQRRRRPLPERIPAAGLARDPASAGEQPPTASGLPHDPAPDPVRGDSRELDERGRRAPGQPGPVPDVGSLRSGVGMGRNRERCLPGAHHSCAALRPTLHLRPLASARDSLGVVRGPRCDGTADPELRQHYPRAAGAELRTRRFRSPGSAATARRSIGRTPGCGGGCAAMPASQTHRSGSNASIAASIRR